MKLTRGSHHENVNEKRKETRNPTTFHFVTLSDLTWVLDYHNIMIVISHSYSSHGEDIFCVYCRSLSCSLRLYGIFSEMLSTQTEKGWI